MPRRTGCHNGVDLAVYYHPAHAWNVDRMLDALKAALDYYQANFGPYQFDQARIIEFPGYDELRPGLRQHHALFGERSASSPTISDPDKIDYVTYVTAHELGHQ